MRYLLGSELSRPQCILVIAIIINWNWSHIQIIRCVRFLRISRTNSCHLFSFILTRHCIQHPLIIFINVSKRFLSTDVTLRNKYTKTKDTNEERNFVQLFHSNRRIMRCQRSLWTISFVITPSCCSYLKTCLDFCIHKWEDCDTYNVFYKEPVFCCSNSNPPPFSLTYPQLHISCLYILSTLSGWRISRYQNVCSHKMASPHLDISVYFLMIVFLLLY